jgi:hypothetical protein
MAIGLILVVLCTAPATGQSTAVPLAEPLQESLLRTLPDSLRTRGVAAVSEPDPARRARIAEALLNTPGTAAFLLGLIERDPSPMVRGRFVRALQSPGLSLASHPDTPGVLERLASADSSVAVALSALEALRVMRMTATSELLNRRLAVARSAADSAAVRQLLAEQERWISLRKAVMLPAFLRRVPPVFQARPDTSSRIRVLAFGDYGVGDSAQRRTAAAMRAYHRRRPFDFGLTLGDNFYNVGMLSTDDPRWKTQFEDLYAPLGIKLYASLGNHDWGHPDSPAAEILYSQMSRTWRMPAPYYSFTAGPVQFFAIDTQEMSDAQLAWLDDAISSSRARWKVVYGHFHVFSATRLDNAQLMRRLVPVIANRVDVYLCGHDHNLQALKPEHGVHYFVAGSGGAGTYQMDTTYARSISRFRTHGFAVLEATRSSLTVRLVDSQQKELYATTLRK